MKKNKKTKIIIVNLLAAFFLKGLGLAVSLFTMPAYMNYFVDNQILGVWFTILSILTWILNFDFGIGNGLRNKLSEALTIKDERSAQEFISSAYFITGIVVVAITLLGFLVIPFINWHKVFNITIEVVPNSVIQYAVKAVFFAIMLQFFLRTITSIVYALQYSAINSFTSFIVSVVQVVVVLCLPISSPQNNLKTLSVAYILTANIPLIILTVWVFKKPLNGKYPKFEKVKINKAKSMLGLGTIFFLCQVLYMFIVNTNEFFISHYINPSFVVEYQIYNRLFSLGSILLTLTLTPVWSAVSMAIAENDFNWIMNLYKKIKLFSIPIIIFEFVLVFFLQVIVNFWLKEKSISVNFNYGFAFAIFGSIMMYHSILSTFVCGMGKMKLQAFSYGGGVIFKFLLIHFGIEVFNSWIIVIISNVIVLVPYCIIQEIYLLKMIDRRSVCFEK